MEDAENLEQNLEDEGTQSDPDKDTELTDDSNSSPESINSQEDDIQSEGPPPYIIPPFQEPDPEDIQEDVSQAAVDQPVEEKVPESKMRSFFRSFIRWTAGLLIVFGLGLIAGIFGLYRPAVQQFRDKEDRIMADFDTANEDIKNLKNQISDLESQISNLQPFKASNDELLVEQRMLKLHSAILDARLDVATALLAIKNDDLAQTLVILEKTTNTLDQISDLLEDDKRAAVTDLKNRLDLVLSEIDKDPYAAQSDLDVLAAKLLQLEDSLIIK